MEVVTFLLGQLVRFAIFLAITLAVVFPFYYAVLSSGDRGDDRSATALFWRVMFWIVVALIVYLQG